MATNSSTRRSTEVRRVIVTERPKKNIPAPPTVVVENTRDALADLAAAFYQKAGPYA